ncbi:MAG: 2-hydroxychromene-2-carboxylate isomerase [Proteobacteria bacterium]|nr:2-hydroxychromene-2-carboxylate isomerase [Pseudomonadota bacterium]
MKRITFWLDFISPFAYLAFERLPQALQGCSYAVDYRPLLFAGLLQQHGQKGPAEIEPKRAWTFRHVHWLAHRHGVPMDTPLQHPFNPLPLLRLALACGPNRRVCEAIFRHVWRGGGDALDAGRLAALQAELTPPRDGAAPAVKAELKAATDEAIAHGVFGVPSFALDGRLFWGLDALPMLAAALQGDPWFDGPAWAREGAPRAGVRRG